MSIDPRDFGALEAKVEALEIQITIQNRKIDELLALANRGRGAIWLLTLAAGALGAGASTIVHKWI